MTFHFVFFKIIASLIFKYSLHSIKAGLGPVFVFLFCILSFSACQSNQKKGNGKNQYGNKDSLIVLPAPANVSAESRLKIKSACEKWFDTVLKSRGFNGSMILAKNGQIIFEKYYGTGHLPGNDSINADMPMHIASVSKTFTAMATLKLMQEGKLKLDDEYSKYFPAFNYPGVTIRSLLSHRSGLPNYTYFMEKLGWDKSRFVTNKDVMEYLVNRKAELTDISAPESHFAYCNTNFVLLAMLIEKVTGKTYAQYLQETFFSPLQMKDTYVFKLSDTTKAIPSYDWRGKQEPYTFLDAVYGDKNIYTTVRDLLIWDRALSTNLLFTPATLQMAYTAYSNERPGIRNYGLGWRMYLYPGADKIIYHNGWWHGSNTAFIRLLADSVTIIVIGNRFNRAIYHARDLIGIFNKDFSTGEDEEPVLQNELKDSLEIKKQKSKKR